MKDKPAEKSMLCMTLKYNDHSSDISSCKNNFDNYIWFLWVNVGYSGVLDFNC